MTSIDTESLIAVLKKINAYLRATPSTRKERFIEGFIFYENELDDFRETPELVIARDTLHGWLRAAQRLETAKKSTFHPHAVLVKLHTPHLVDYYDQISVPGAEGAIESGNSVYLITEKPFAGFFKVGVVTKGTLHERLHDLQTGNARHLVIVNYIRCKSAKDAKFIETFLHRAFAKNRAVGEWFACDTERDLNYVRAAFHLFSPDRDGFTAVLSKVYASDKLLPSEDKSTSEDKTSNNK